MGRYILSRDMFSALRVARRLECGQVNVNTVTEFDEASAPIGGVKGSGWGRNNGKFGLREFLVEKWCRYTSRTLH
jgi:acyl-CoA reductase-like NAD-dependent aldehyde dehydrogenase